jgi:3-oxoacyl-[acyl-carrier protein] reductase
MQIKFETALITGSSRGLGRQIAVKLATEAVSRIAIHCRTGKSDAETTLSLIEAAGASGVLVQGDVADAVVAESLMKEAAQKLEGVTSSFRACAPVGRDL